MAFVDDQLSEQFRKWERLGRGWRVWDMPVSPEPPFKPFPGHVIESSFIDDGRKPTAISSFVERIARALGPKPPPHIPEEIAEAEPEPESLEREGLVEIKAS